MSDHEHARADQVLTAGLMLVMTASYLAYLGYAVWRDMQATRDARRFRDEMTARIAVRQREWEPES